MSYEIAPLLDPASTALVVFECQDGILGDASHLPGLAEAARRGKLVPNIAALLEAARASAVRVFFCTVARRADGIGDPLNTPLAMRLQRQSAGPGAGPPEMGEVVAALAPRDGEVVVRREHGLTGFYESGLDAYLRNTGVRSIVLTGVSVNIGILGTAIEAVNRGYVVIVPSDCVAGDPEAYAAQALRFSVRNVAFLASREEVERAWRSSPRESR